MCSIMLKWNQVKQIEQVLNQFKDYATLKF